MTMPYTVALQGVDDLPPAERIAAEMRFLKEIEKNLRSPEAVVQAWRAWHDACEMDASELSHETSNLAVKWPKAFDAAQRAGLKTIGESDAHFEFRLERQSPGSLHA